jgi:hypothetical protein
MSSSEEDKAVARSLSIRAAMFFPNDEDRRHQFIDSSLGNAARVLLERGFHKTLEADEAIRLFELAHDSNSYDRLIGAALRKVRRNHMTVRRDQGEAAEPPGGRTPILAGSIAGNALLIPFICNLKYSLNSVGLHQAFRVILKTDQVDDPAGFRNLQSVWKHYKPVAHFWAAWDLLDYGMGSTLDGITEFVSVAELIRAWGEQYKPLRASESILDARITARIPLEWIAPLFFDVGTIDLDEEAKALLLN